MVILAMVTVVGLYGWIARPAVSQLLGHEEAKTAYYNLLIDGFLAGQLHMQVEPHPELARLANPYDPALNAPYRLHDATYFHGRYYLYFGVTPALVLFLPYHWLTGGYLWHKEAVFVFSAGGFLVAAWLLCLIRARYFPKAGGLALVVGIAGMGLGNTVPILLRRPDVWEVPISCAAFFVMLSLAAVWQALHAGRGKFGWILAASTAYGLAVGARPSVLLGAAILLAPVAHTRWAEAGDWRRCARLLGAAVVPIALIGVGLLLYNHLRFGDALQFGQKYQLAGVDNTQVRFFSPQFFWYHLRLYLWEPVQWTNYFPFVLGINPPPPPAGQLGIESVFGVLTNIPLAWFGLLAPLGVAAGRARATWWSWLAAAGFFSVGCGATVCLFGGACNRYLVDFLPPWMLVSAAGLLALEHCLAGSARRWLARGLWIPVAVGSGAIGFFASCQHLGLLRRLAPESYAGLAGWFNRPVAWAEDRLGVRPGPLELTVRLPPFTGSRYEALLVTGAAPEADYLWVQYADGRHLQLGFEHTGHGGPASQLLEVDYDRPHTVMIQLGSLYPPAEHAYWNTPQGRGAADTRNRLRVFLDDRVALEGVVATYDASPLRRMIGRNPYAQNMGRDFTGQVLGARTLAWPPEPGVGPLELLLSLPADRPAGRAEPLVQTGVRGRADTLWIRYLDASRVVFGLDHWGSGGPESAPIEIKPDAVQRLEIHLGSLYPPGAENSAKHRLLVKCNGRVALDAPQDFHPSAPAQVVFGANPSGATTAVERFSGSMLDAHWLAPRR
jgi:hypothetical protein